MDEEGRGGGRERPLWGKKKLCFHATKPLGLLSSKCGYGIFNLRHLTDIKGRKLKWYGHVSRSLALAKTISEGKAKGGKRQGRQMKIWEDNIRARPGVRQVPEGSGEQREKKNGGNWL